MHVEDEQIQRFLADELDPASRRGLAEHLAGCDLCQGKLAEAEREEEWIAERLGHVDHPAPATSPAWIARRARRRARRGWQRVAAALVVLAAAGAAYSAPGSPLPGWVARLSQWFGRASDPPPEPFPNPQSAAEEPGPASSTGGIAVLPGERFTVRFTHPQARGTATVRLAAGPNLTARVYGGGATFTAGAGVLTIENRGAVADYAIELPADAPWIAIEVGERQLLTKDGARIEAVKGADAGGSYQLPLAAPGARDEVPGAQ